MAFCENLFYRLLPHSDLPHIHQSTWKIGENVNWIVPLVGLSFIYANKWIGKGGMGLVGERKRKWSRSEPQREWVGVWDRAVLAACWDPQKHLPSPFLYPAHMWKMRRRPGLLLAINWLRLKGGLNSLRGSCGALLPLGRCLGILVMEVAAKAQMHSCDKLATT